MKITKYFLLFISLLAFAWFYLTNLPAIGKPPSKADLQLFEKSPHFDAKIQQFVNRQANILNEMRENGLSFALYKEWVLGKQVRAPRKALPQDTPNLEKFLQPSQNIKLIWFGHSTILLNLSGTTVLIDPIFSPSASPISFLIRRFQEPALNLEQLPKVDYIVISHDHYDHLDMHSVKFFKGKETLFLVPLGVSSHLKSWGISPKKIHELDWWQEKEFANIKFVATPAQHFSGRNFFDGNKTLWASWVIKQNDHRIYFSGDSGYDTHYKKIGEKFGPFDIAFIENGQYNQKWKAVHLLPEESAQAYFDLKAKKYFPIHWGLFQLSFHSWYDPIVRINKISKEKNIHLVAPKMGEIISIENESSFTDWWQSLIK